MVERNNANLSRDGQSGFERRFICVDKGEIDRDTLDTDQ